MTQINDPQPMGIKLNREQAALILKGLEALPPEDKRSVIYSSVKKDAEKVILFWDRIIKNQKIELDKKKQKK